MFVQSKLSQDATHNTKVYISRVADNKKKSTIFKTRLQNAKHFYINNFFFLLKKT